jgi:type VI secretion system secreted protein Hcp
LIRERLALQSVIALFGQDDMALDDMFLKIEGARHGPIKGESRDESHKDEIDVIGWSWGMRAQTEMAGAGKAGKAALNEFKVVKRTDSASTALMSAMRNNEIIKKAVLTVRKAGGAPLEYLKVTIQNGRITLFDVQPETGGDAPGLVEHLSLAYQKITVEYLPQGADGQKRGGMSFETEINPS